jgi:hypothetical protein
MLLMATAYSFAAAATPALAAPAEHVQSPTANHDIFVHKNIVEGRRVIPAAAARALTASAEHVHIALSLFSPK